VLRQADACGFVSGWHHDVGGPARAFAGGDCVRVRAWWTVRAFARGTAAWLEVRSWIAGAQQSRAVARSCTHHETRRRCGSAREQASRRAEQRAG
jgi:hypothetical protein